MFELRKEILDWEKCFNNKAFERVYCTDKKLGNFYSREKTLFRVWCPLALSVDVNIYNVDGYTSKENLLFSKNLKKIDNGTWEIEIYEDLKNKYYTYEYTFDCLKKQDFKKKKDLVNYIYVEKANLIKIEAADIYGKASGINGRRTMIIDMAETNPPSWDTDVSPEFNNPTDAVIYELHVRDFSSDENSGIKNKKKYLAFTETGTKNAYGDSTCLDHIKELGVTHIHLLPVQDFGSIDESIVDNVEYNWGYDPYNYNVPEGSYSTNSSDGRVRIRELKEAICAIHKAGIRVVLDVVYNHTYDTKDSLFDKVVPNYYHRTRKGAFTNGSGCGNETASERYMYKKYMIDSLTYWIEEYHVDGFRFDLMAIHDIETMNHISKTLAKYNKNILLYGEGWCGGESGLEYKKAAFKNSAKFIDGIAMFNDDGRDSIKGSVFVDDNTGFATGAMFLDNPIYKDKSQIINNIKFMLVGSNNHPQVQIKELYPWADTPKKVINYVSAHDNMTLWDKIQVSHHMEDRETLIIMNKFAMAIVFLSQGIPFIHAGDEILRSKVNPKCKSGFDDNSYRSEDTVNSIKWNDKTKNIEVFNYYKGLIEYRKCNSLLRMDNKEQIGKRIIFEDVCMGVILSKLLDDNGEIKTINIFNGLDRACTVDLPKGKVWKVYVDGEIAGDSCSRIVKEKVTVEALSALSVMDS